MADATEVTPEISSVPPLDHVQSIFFTRLHQTAPTNRLQYLRNAAADDQNGSSPKPFGRGRVFLAFEDCLSQYWVSTENHKSTNAREHQETAEKFLGIARLIVDEFPDILGNPSPTSQWPTRDPSGDSALHIATRRMALPIVEALLARLLSFPADRRVTVTQWKNKNEKTALTAAVECMDKAGDINARVVEALLRADPGLLSDAAAQNADKKPLHSLLQAISAVELVDVVDPESSQPPAIIDDVLRITDIFVDVSPDVLLQTNSRNQTPYVTVQDLQRQAGRSAKAVVFKQLGETIKMHIFQSFYTNRDKLDKAIYSGSSVNMKKKIMELDLSDFDYHKPKLTGNSETISEEVLVAHKSTIADFAKWLEEFRRQSDNFAFDDWLAYVRLPDMSWVDVPFQLRNKLQMYYEKLMETLSRSFGVTRIWKLVVKDAERFPISDRLIGKFVKDFQVVELDWYKLDLDIDRLQPTSHLRKIKLYSSCSWAPIFFWTSAEGLVKLPQLRDAEIKLIKQDLGDEDVLMMKNRAKKRIRALEKRQPPEQKLNLKIMVTTGSSHAPPEVAFPDANNPMDRFYNDLKPAQELVKSRGCPCIKIAILDVGIDAWESTVRDNIVTGVSYPPATDAEKRIPPWFTASHPHGTYMAHLIRTINPRCEFYNYRVGTFRTDIDPKNAALAIQDAVSRQVDIINCSWTTRVNDADLRNAIHEANNANTLVFCAAYNEPSYHKSYPAAYDDDVISVAAATARGRARLESADKVDLLVLGENVKVAGPQYLPLSKEVDSGSSVATAFASGLASLLLAYCRLYAAELPPRGWFEYRQRSNMVKLFRLMQPGHSQNHKFVDPGFLFREKCGTDGTPNDEIIQYFQSVNSLPRD